MLINVLIRGAFVTFLANMACRRFGGMTLSGQLFEVAVLGMFGGPFFLVSDEKLALGVAVSASVLQRQPRQGLNVAMSESSWVLSSSESFLCCRSIGYCSPSLLRSLRVP